MFFFDQHFERNVYYNLAIEEAIALNLISSPYSAGIRFWKNSNSVILGISEKIADTVQEQRFTQFRQNFKAGELPPKAGNGGLLIARRASGGGTVFHDNSSNLNFSFFISLKLRSDLFPVTESYKKILGMLISALQIQNIQSRFEGKCDLAMEADGVLKKISGNAQFRKKECLVHHGTIILDTDILKGVRNNLKHPPVEPDYRKNRSHENFITSVGATFSVEKFKKNLFQLFAEFMDYRKLELDRRFYPKITLFDWKKILKDTNRLYKEKYTDLNFITGRE
ncbi:MAG: lipoate--protein ligase family protein [Leptospira sp.]|nr:lipoate--protein ligase family protein [Leptospira sp.]